MQYLIQMVMQKWGRVAVRQATNRNALLLSTSVMMAMLLVGCGEEFNVAVADGEVSLLLTEKDISNLTYVDPTLYFSADDGVHGSEPWKSDGTPENTVMVKNINPGNESSDPSNFIGYEDKLLV